MKKTIAANPYFSAETVILNHMSNSITMPEREKL